MRIKITTFRLAISVVVLIVGGTVIALFLTPPKPILSWRYDGLMEFRADLREAQRVPILPDERTLHDLIMNPNVENITIVFKPAPEKENPWYIIEEMEIITKLVVAYHLKGWSRPEFDAVPVESYAGLSGTSANPLIALVHPVYANRTLVEVKNEVIFIEGKDYKGFDLATVRFLMAVLGIDIA